MTPERWVRIKEVFQTALELEESERAPFVDNACRSDTGLKAEVMRLLGEHRESIVQPRRDMSGHTISHYRIIEQIGEGGMGVVYKAEDTRLHRTVALKFLRPDAIESGDLKTRFLQEARAAAALDHPNICTVHEIGESDGHTFLAMAYVHGESLADRIRQRPLPLEEALSIAAQTAEGLQAAHERGVIHRDIKSANVMVTNRGQVKIMDFGLAHLACGTRITTAGAIMGTPAYMSPEQVRGQDLDRRTDIWSLGVVIYEIVTGRLPFRGDSKTVALAIQNDEPEPITALRAGLPMELEFIAAKALAKDRDERYQNAEELVVDLKSVSRKIASGTSRIAPSRTAVLPRSRSTPWAIAAAAVVALLAVAFVFFRRPVLEPPQPSLRRFTLRAPVPVPSDWWARSFAISPDGKHVAMAAATPGGKLWVQDLDRWEPRALDGTEGAAQPFWSPDSEYVAYSVGNELMKVRIQGGPPARVCQLPNPWFLGGTWSPDGESIVFASDELFEVPASGGAARPLPLPDKSIERKYLPWFLPARNGARIIVFGGGRGTQNLYLFDLQTGRLQSLGRGCKPSYSPSGHVVYQPDEFVHELWALPLSLDELAPSGKAFILAQRGSEPSVAADGTLIYREPRSRKSGFFTWVDRSGKEIERIELENVWNQYQSRISPDGKFLAFLGRASSGVELSVWIHDIVRRRNVRLTSDPGRELVPAWSPSGEYLVFTSNRTGTFNIYLRRADGSGETRALTTTGNNFATDWSRDGKYILYEETESDRFGDIWYLERSGDAWRPKPFLRTPNGERFGRLSPDGRFIAYLSNETGREELYVRPFPAGEGRWTISTGGSSAPFWRSDGRELFYQSEGSLMAVPVSTNPGFSMGTPVKLFTKPGLSHTNDGQRFIVFPPDEESTQPVIRVVQNWYAEFRNSR